MPRRPVANRPRIGAPLTELREGRFLTQAELAHALGVDEQTVSRWERNQSGPQTRRLRQVAEFFGVEPGALIEDPTEAAA